MQDINTLKRKFAQAQEIEQSLKETRIRLETEIKNLEADYKKELQELLELTGEPTYEKAVEHYKKELAEIEAEKEQLAKELDNYIAATAEVLQ